MMRIGKRAHVCLDTPRLERLIWMSAKRGTSRAATVRAALDLMYLAAVATPSPRPAHAKTTPKT